MSSYPLKRPSDKQVAGREREAADTNHSVVNCVQGPMKYSSYCFSAQLSKKPFMVPASTSVCTRPTNCTVLHFPSHSERSLCRD